MVHNQFKIAWGYKFAITDLYHQLHARLSRGLFELSRNHSFTPEKITAETRRSQSQN